MTEPTFPESRPEFDEQFWPINVAILVLAACVAGVVVTQGEFSLTDGRWLHNGSVQLALVVLLLGILVWAAAWLQAHAVRRVQLCILISLLVHLWLVMYLHAQYLAVLAEEGIDDRRLARPEERITIPDYDWHHPDQPRSVQSFEKPVETESPEQSEVDPVEMEPVEHEVERPELAEPAESDRLPEPVEPVELRRTERERLGETPLPETELSRYDPMHRARPDARIVPPEAPPPADAPSQFDTRVAAIVREVTAAGIVERQEVDEPVDAAVPRWSPRPSRPARPRDRPEASPAELRAHALARSRSGLELPSTAPPIENVEAPAAPGGATPSRIEMTSEMAAVERSRDLALRQRSAAAAGAAEFALGSVRIEARLGQTHARDRHRPSVDPTAHAERIARSPTGAPLPTTPSVEAVEADSVVAAFGSGGPSDLRPDVQGTPIDRAGSAGIPPPRTVWRAGAGAEAPPGTSGRMAAEPLVHLSGRPSAVPADAGGGSPMPARRFGRALSADASVEAPQAAGDTPRAGAAAGTPFDALLSGPDRQPVGLPGAHEAALAAGAPTALTLDGSPRPVAVARRAPASQEGPGRIGTSPNRPATLVKAAAGPLLPAAAAPVDDAPFAGAGGLAPSPGAAPSSLEPGDYAALGRITSGAEPGRGDTSLGTFDGHDSRPSLTPSIAPRSARAGASPGAAPAVPRAEIAKRAGLVPSLGGAVALPVEAFQQRDPARRSEAARRYGATEGSERAVEAGLDFLVRYQFPDGRWSLDQLPQARQGARDAFALGQTQADTAATGLALLAFLGAGYTHLDNRHRTVVAGGIDWLVANQQPGGELFTVATDAERAGRIYAHGIGSIALCEAFGMTRDPRLREPAQKAIDFICRAQHPTWGGWRYTKRDDQDVWRKESDTSVSGWMVMALKSAQMAELDVPSSVMQRAVQWLDLAQVDGGARYVYNPYAADDPSQREGRLPNLAMTAEGLLMRMYLGWDRSQPALVRGADHLGGNVPRLDPRDPSVRDAYYWYYATQVMFQMQGEHWEAWNGSLRPLLTQTQVQQGPLAGSWHPNDPVPDRWAHVGGRIYVTSLNLLMLEVYYRYLPLFRMMKDEG